MTTSRLRAVRFTTESVPPKDRIARWEEYNAEALVGLSCTTFADQGLRAAQRNVDLDGLRLAEIHGNAHVIERSPARVRAMPKDAVLVSLLLTGEAFFYHSTGCMTVRAGDMVLYDADRPYAFGFCGAMRQVMLDLPRELFAARCVSGGVARPVRVRPGESGSAGVDALSGGVLRSLAAGGDADQTTVDITRQHLLDLLSVAAAGGAGPAGAAHLVAAKDFIRRHLRDRDLTPAKIVRAVGISERHLHRIFAADGTSVARHLLDSRLDRAYTELAGADRPRVADVAYQAGFGSQAHFTRVFRNRFAMTPSAVRRR